MKIKPFLFCLAALSFGSIFSIRAQISPGSLGYFEDAIRFSRIDFGGTARFEGLSGAQVALGGDIGSANANPAGLGFNRKSEFSFSPGFQYARTSTDYFDLSESPVSSTDDNRSNFNINHLGIIISQAKDDLQGGKWRGGSFAFTLTREANFHNRFSYQGLNQNSSRTDFLVDITNGIPAGELENLDLTDIELQRAAYFAFLTNPFFLDQDGNADPNNVDYFTFARDEFENLLGPIQQSETVTTEGAQYRTALSYGGNYNDQLYFGFSLGLSTINFTQNNSYREEIQNNASFLESFEQIDELRVRGTGVDAKIGLIYRAFDFLRLGASFSSPRWYFLNEEFSTRFISNVFNTNDILETFDETTLPGEFDYRLRTPWRLNAGASFFIGKKGFISAEAEYVDYSSMKLSSRDFEGIFDGDNQSISNIFQPVWNYRLGAEFRQGIFRLRAGVSLEDDPYDDIDDISRKITRISGGLGVRQREWYADLSVTHHNVDAAYLPYSFDNNSINAGTEPITQRVNRFLTFVISTGFYFDFY